MTNIVYSLIYLLPLVFVSASDLMPRLLDVSEMTDARIVLIPMLAVAFLLTTLVHVNQKARIITISSLTALVAGIILVTDNSILIDWLAVNSWIWIAIGATFIIVALEVMMIKLRPVKLFVGIGLFGVLLSSYWSGLICEKLSVVSIIFLSLTVILEEIRRHKRGSDHIIPFVVRIVPFVLLGMIGLYYIPYSEKPYDWAFVKRIYDKISDDIIIFTQSLDTKDSVGDMASKLGFSEAAGLTGNTVSSPEEVMRVSMENAAPNYLYLDGKYYEDFNGQEWTESEETYSYMMDLIEAFCALSMVDGNKLNDYRKIQEIHVTYLNQKSRYVFAPTKSYASNIEVDKVSVDCSKNEILFSKRRGFNTEYRVRYLLINRKDSIIPQLFETADSLSQAIWESSLDKLGLNKDIYSYQNFLKFRDTINNNSMCPNAISKEKLSNEVLEFLTNATEGATSVYDKLMSLEKAFADFEYTTTPGAVPDYVDTPYEFLDYFIIDLKKGYCNSFATAYALLCQAEGIPVRYVHGYMVPKTKGGDTIVYSTMAHAYVEAYLPGIGWMVFDPTPGYTADVLWDEKGEYVFAPMPERQTKEDILENEEEETESIDEEQGNIIKWYMVAIPVALSIFVLAVFAFLERNLNRRRFERLSKNEKAYTKCLWMMKILKHMKLIKAENETISEYAKRATSKLGISLIAFPRIMEKTLYSTISIEDSEYDEISQELDELYSMLEGKEKVVIDILRFMHLC